MVALCSEPYEYVSTVEHHLSRLIYLLILLTTVCCCFYFPGGKIVSSKPFAPLNFRINSRNLSGKYHDQWKADFNVSCSCIWHAVPCFLFYLSCRYWHNNACGGAFSTQGLRVLDWKASFLLLAYHRPYHSKYWSSWRKTHLQRLKFLLEESFSNQ